MKNNKLKRNILFVSIVVFIVIAFFAIKKSNDSYGPKDNELRLGFVTDIEYSGDRRVNEKFGEKGVDFARGVVKYFNEKFHPEVVIVGGDLVVGSRTESELAKKELGEMVEVFKKIDARLIYSIGSRDIENISKKEVLDELGLERSYYSYDYKDYRFVVLDTSLGFVDKEQIEWLKGELNTEGPVIVISHSGIVESPKDVVWKSNLKNKEEVQEILNENGNVLFVLSGNSSNNFVTKKSDIPYIFIAGLTEKEKSPIFSNISVIRNENKFEIELSMFGENGKSNYKIKRYLFSGKKTKISNETLDGSNVNVAQLWKDLGDDEFPQGVISDGKGAEVGIASNEQGVVVGAFEDKKNDGKISIKKYQDGKWFSLGNKESVFVSFGKGGNPSVAMNGDEVYAAFTETDYGEKPRVVKWDGEKWVGLSDKNHPDGFISDFVSLETVLAFDKSKKYLYVAFNEGSVRGSDFENKGYRVKLMRWDGDSWSVASERPDGFVVSQNSAEVDIEASHIDDSMFLAFEDTNNENMIKVLKWDGKNFSVLSDKSCANGFIGCRSGHSPSMSVDDENSIYLTYSYPKLGKAYAFKWDGETWNPLGEGSIVSALDTIEGTIISDGSGGDILVAYSEFRSGRVLRNIDGKKEEFENKGGWRIRVRKFVDGEWTDFGDDDNGYVSFGSGKGDPSLTISGGQLCIIFTDEENENGARVKCSNLERS